MLVMEKRKEGWYLAPTVQRESSSHPGETETEKHWKLLRGKKVKEKTQQQRSKMLFKTLALVLLLELKRKILRSG